MSGGGVGFYVKDSLNACVLENLSPFENKIMESITIQLSYLDSNKSLLLTSVYRSNSPIPLTLRILSKWISSWISLLHYLLT
jgi:hypothetical protein